jgi:ABC-type branched-subunit amino acid transport system ATPase component/ABC-type branched-subunit amino acid transport system permease subunit
VGAMTTSTSYRTLAGLGVLAALILLPAALASFQLYFVTIILVYTIVAIGLNILMGYTGQISVANGAFMGLGAYTTVLLMSLLGLNVLPALVGAMVLTAALGFLVGIPALRIRGHYLALATLAFQLIVETVIMNWTSLTGGPNGQKVPDATLGPWILKDLLLYYFVLLVALLAFLFARNLLRSRFGRALIGIRDHEVAATVMGVDVTWHKTFAFALSSAYAGLAGGLFAITVAFLDPLAFTVWESVKHLIMVILGGLGTLVGPVIGATLIAAAPELLRGFREHSLLIYYALLLMLLLFMPGGVASGLERLLRAIVTRRHASIATGREPLVSTGSAAGAKTVLPARAPVARGNGKPLLEVSGVGVTFGGLAALSNVSFTVSAGEIKGLIGPNGAGKTSMFNVLTRVYQPTSGSVAFNGRELLQVKAHEIVKLGLSRTFQNVEMFGSMTVLENVLVGMHHSLQASLLSSGLALGSQQREEREAVEKATSILKFLDLEGLKDAMANQLPLGTQRRVELARALAAGPTLLLLDEPASGLTHSEADRLMADVRALRDSGITVLLIEHDMRFVMGLCDSITVLDRGEVICIGTPAEARANPRVIEAYLGKENAAHA